MRALFAKEWREHRWVLLAALGLLAIGQSLTLYGADRLGSPMVAYQRVVAFFMPLTALIVTNRLVVREYMGRTQLFLETLPVSRTQVLAVKWLFGAAVLVLAMAACLGATLFIARDKVMLTPHYVVLVAVRSASFLFAGYALAFAVGLTCRYRYVVWGLLFMVAVAVNTIGQQPILNWAPLYLVHESMVYERLILPASAVLSTCAIAVALCAATFALALSAQGSLVVALSRRMSAREKSAVTVGFLALTVSMTLIETRKPKPPFELAAAVHSAHGPAVAVGIVFPVAAAQRLADVLSSDLARLQAFLGLPDPPMLTALPDDALDGDAFQRAALPNADGVVVRAAFTDKTFDQEGFRAYALAAWMRWHSRGSAAEESRRWLLDGVAQWLIARDSARRQETLALRAAFAARRLRARSIGAGRVLREWLTVREELGACLADALAWRMVSSLAGQTGDARFRALGRSVLAERPDRDLRASLRDPGVDRLLARAGAPDRTVLAQRFDRLFGAEQERLADALDWIDLPQVRFSARRMAGTSFEVHYRPDAGGGQVAPFWILYHVLGPWDGDIPAEVPARVDDTRPGVLPASFVRGTRLFTALERRDALLGCNVRLAAQRWEVK